MSLRDVSTAAALVSRGRRAGATCATAFADWLIIDEQWFGPCEGMDTATYQRWRRRAEAIYSGSPDVYVSAHDPFGNVGVATPDPLVPAKPSGWAGSPGPAGSSPGSSAGSGAAAAFGSPRRWRQPRRSTPSEPPDPEASKFVKAFIVILVVLLLVALASASEALSKGPTHHAPASPPHGCSLTVGGGICTDPATGTDSGNR